VLEALIRAGSMDGLGASRAVLMAAMGEAVRAAEQRARAADVGLVDMFADAPAAAAVPEAVEVYRDFAGAPEWSVKERLRGEKETLGLYVTGHPIDDYEGEISQFVRTRIAALRPEEEPVRIAGLVVGVRTMKNKRGEDMAFVTLDDRTARIEVSLFADAWRACRELVVRDTIVVIEGTVSLDDYTGGLRMRGQEVYTLADARQRYAQLVLHLDAQQFAPDFANVLGRLLGGNLPPTAQRREGRPVRVVYTGGGARAEISLGTVWRVPLSDEVLVRLRERFGPVNVRLKYAS